MSVITPDSLLTDIKPLIKGEVTNAEAPITEASSDFGRLIERRPLVVVFPKDAEDVAAVIKYARKNSVSIHTQGAQHSQSGQSLGEGGIVLSMKKLCNEVEEIDEQGHTVTVQAGCVWRDMVEKVHAKGLIPPVLTNNLGVTIGGTLSMAGLGVASFRYGTQGDTALMIEAVTGEGEIIRATREENEEVFWSMLSTLGTFGVITKATIQLRPVGEKVRTYYLLYDDIDMLLKDSATVMEDGRIDYIEGWASPCMQGLKTVNGMRQGFAEWFYPLQLCKEFSAGDEPSKEAMLDGLSPYRVVHEEDLDAFDYFNRLVPVFQIWKMLGTWDNPHPWVECVLNYDQAGEYIKTVLKDFPPGALTGGHILLWPCRSDTSRAPLFMRPEGNDNLMGFGLLPSLPKDLVPMAMPKLDMASDLSMEMGAKRYLSGWTDFTKEQWAEHYGDKWPRMKELKAKFDPDGIMNPGFIDFSA